MPSGVPGSAKAASGLIPVVERSGRAGLLIVSSNATVLLDSSDSTHRGGTAGGQSEADGLRHDTHELDVAIIDDLIGREPQGVLPRFGRQNVTVANVGDGQADADRIAEG